MRVYVAGSTREVERVNHVQALVLAAGWAITFDWTGPEGEIRDSGWDAAAEKGALISSREIEACKTADLTIVLCPPAGLGCWIEMGASLAAGGEVWVVDPVRDSVFWQHPQVQRMSLAECEQAIPRQALSVPGEAGR
jgi:hypothetical protein